MQFNGTIKLLSHIVILIEIRGCPTLSHSPEFVVAGDILSRAAEGRGVNGRASHANRLRRRR